MSQSYTTVYLTLGIFSLQKDGIMFQLTKLKIILKLTTWQVGQPLQLNYFVQQQNLIRNV